MNIWIDICHIPQFNFFKPVIMELAGKGNKVYVTVLDRGKTAKIMKHELADVENVQLDVIGKHRMTKWSAIWDANLIRMLKLMMWIPGKHIDVALSTNIFTSFLGWLFRIKNYSYGDDPQVFDLRPNSWFATKAHMCIYEWTLSKPKPKRTIVLPCLKEWAYLNPRTFRPDRKALEQYGVKAKEYMFLREVSVGTINYTGQESGAILGIKDMIPKGMKVLLSLEEKKRRGEYPEDWILLQEPIEDIHSLIYYAAGLVSSGDSMAREAALMGVPAYYLGIRYTMPANAAASKVAGLQNRMTMPFEEWISNIIENKNIKNQDKNIENIIDDSKSKKRNPQSSEDALCVTAPQSACEQAPRQSDDQSHNAVVIDDQLQVTHKKDDLQSSQKSVSLSKKDRLLQQQIELRQHIDEEFIDINQYMLELVESVGEQKR